MVSDPLSKTKKSNQINRLTPLNKISNEIKHIASELEVVKQMNDSELSEHSVVESSDYSSSVVSTVVPSDLHYSSSVVVVKPSEVPSDHLCSVVVCSEEI
jgi:hypothetical protein